ncbi:Gfo/Idh/MocA family protein [Rhizobium sp. X9]|uniref:Gfo/Idh/MocA family protein n=1 Tax=Rhizobium sp. X9 TaxID=2815360 RepID=UPI001C0CDFCC|nr:Gfo/Idh/MocA family oxidoreductase [Rhizobium sp. X9]
MTEEKTIGVGMIGHAFMGKTHSIGYRDVPVIAPLDVPRPRLKAIYGRDTTKLEEARQRYGWERAVSDWREIIDDPDIQLVDNVGPNSIHVEPIIAAARAGKHVYCEKPLAPDAAQSFEMWKVAHEAGVKHMCAFNYRFFPALQLARQMIQDGELGDIYHFRSNFLVSSSLSENRVKGWRDDKTLAGSGALGDLGSHHIDISRFLLSSDPVRATAVTGIAVGKAGDEQRIETDDLFAAILTYQNGALGVLEASRVAGGNMVTSRIEVDGSRGSIRFSMQNLNELEFAGTDKTWRRINVLRDGDPYQKNWLPPGHPLGWVDTFSHEAMHMLAAIGGLGEIAPIGATFRDGYYCAEIVDAIVRSAAERTGADISYRKV